MDHVWLVSYNGRVEDVCNVSRGGMIQTLQLSYSSLEHTIDASEEDVLRLYTEDTMVEARKHEVRNGVDHL